MKHAGFLAIGAMLIATSSGAAEIKWAKSLDSALSTARKANKLVMADFYTDW